MSDQDPKKSPDDPESDASMSVWEHLDELRARLVKSIAAIFLLFLGALFFSNEILEFLKIPVNDLLPEGKNLGFKDVVEPFMVTLKVSFLAALIASCPIWFFQFWKFIEPALYPEERKYIFPFSIASMVLFIVGTSFCFWVILPMALEFLIEWGKQFAEPDITVHGYVSFLTLMVIGFGLVFEAPLILVVLSLLGVVDYPTLVSARRYVIVGCFVVSAMVTPPDWISQIGMAVPLYFMFEVSLLIIKYLGRKKEKEDEEGAAEESDAKQTS